MAITSFSTNFSDFAFLPSIRSDVNFHLFFDVDKANVWPNSTVELSEVLIPIKSDKIEKGELESEEMLVDMANIERRYNELINVSYVSEIGSDKTIIGQGDIIIPKIQPRMGNIFLNLDKNRYICSSELIEYKCKQEMYLPKFLFYIITHPQFAKCLFYSESGKTHRRVNPAELLKYKIPYVEMQKQLAVISQIEAIEDKIRTLRATIKKDEDIINSVIVERFDLNIGKLSIIDNTRFFTTPFEKLSSNNYEIRDSVRYNKLQSIQKEILSNIDSYDVLDAYLLDVKTKNGWSPENNELEGESKILGIDALNFNGILTTDNPKFTNETRADVDKFIVNDGDFFISRGNTVNLVALASVAQNVEEDFIFPDIMIKLFVDDSKINKMFLAYIFNSVIGRLYFKYASKGKQQTMVKVSSDTIRKFVIPQISMSEQEEVVNEIQEETDKQIVVKRKIAKLRSDIDKLICDVIQKDRNL